MENVQVLDAFMLAIAELRDELEALENLADDHLGVSPEVVNWGHVGTARHLLELVREASVAAGLRDE